jgi:protein SCO1/2
LIALSWAAMVGRCPGADLKDATNSTSIPQPPAQQTYQVAGVVKELRPDSKSAVIAHEEIPGYMEAMTMPFPVKDVQELADLKPGDKVTFRLIVTPNEGWIDRVTKVDAPSDQAAKVEETFHIARNVEPLNVGDVVPEYHFTNELGQAVSLSQFRGKAVAFTFFFTRCPFPNFCPRLSNNFEEAQRKLLASPQGPKNWHLLSISFDTRRDTPVVLRHYAQKYGYDPKYWSFLSGDLVEIDALGEQFGEAFWREGESMSHNQRTVVLDTRGRVQRVFIGNEWKTEDLVAEITKAAVVKPVPRT